MTYQTPCGLQDGDHAPAGAREKTAGLTPRNIALALGALIATKFAFLSVYAWTNRFVMDEFGQLGYAKYLGNGLFDTIDPPKAVGFAIFSWLAHLIGWDAVSIVLAARIENGVLACGTIGIVYATSRALGATRLRALAVVLVLLSFSNFIEQIFRARGEQLAVFFAAAALLAVVRGRSAASRTILIAGLLSGLAFLATQKSVYFNVALGLALFGDAFLRDHPLEGVKRGAWLVFGWTLPVILYCFAFGGSDPLAIAANLVFGPAEVATRGGAEYGGLRHYVLQTLFRNAFLYGFCFAGLALGLRRIRTVSEGRRIALIFTSIVTLLVFAHDQPWPYVFVMALPFLALWSLDLFDAIGEHSPRRRYAWLLLGIAIAASFPRNVGYVAMDNRAQLELLARADAMLDRNDVYFDGIGMLPNHAEPSTLWLDRHFVLATLSEGERSEAYRIFSQTPPKLILWSYRMDDIDRVVAPQIRDSYVQVAPNLRIAGRRLRAAETVRFEVPVAGRYGLYSEDGLPYDGEIEIDGTSVRGPVALARKQVLVRLQGAIEGALLLPEGEYAGLLVPGRDNPSLFAGVYD